VKRLHALYTHLAIALGSLTRAQRGAWSARVVLAGRCWRSQPQPSTLAAGFAPSAAPAGGGRGLLADSLGTNILGAMTGDRHRGILTASVEYPGFITNSSGWYKPPDPVALVPS